MVANPKFQNIQVKVSLGTHAILAECVKLSGKDEFGRPIPAYAVVHRAFELYRDKLKAEKQKRKG